MPAAIAYFGDAQMLVLEALDGVIEAEEVETRAITDPDARHTLRGLIALAAQGLPLFQRAIVPGLELVTTQGVLDDCAKDTCFLPGLRCVAPGVARALTALLRRLEDEAL